ncbi:hypothetical protein HFK74_31665|uniref:hypothetical protein n=1 Tax=Pseudomonas sp. SbOxS1 TaxID=2723884 RepID=UPI0015D0EAA4|nr:hypothetical protein [Pseudomonas sp. SbOxS1]NYU07270.1 hypothetical protein [Pseudomonas sp. SbOxS1]
MKELTDDQFHEALNSQDALGLVIRAHIHIEHWVGEFLESTLPQYKRFAKDLNADYDEKVLLACISGLSADLKAPLSSFGKLRNRFAHRPNYELSPTDAENIYASLSAKHKVQIQSAYKKLAEAHKRQVKSYSNLDTEAKINLLAMFLRAKVKKACAQANGT